MATDEFISTPKHQNLKSLCMEALTGLLHIHSPDGLNTTLLSQGCVLGMAPGSWWEQGAECKGSREEPPATRPSSQARSQRPPPTRSSPPAQQAALPGEGEPRRRQKAQHALLFIYVA